MNQSNILGRIPGSMVMAALMTMSLFYLMTSLIRNNEVFELEPS
ncbi:MAG: hypothetical protein VB957_14785 [Pseudomonadales bacterium]